jgi:hypothetical protein
MKFFAAGLTLMLAFLAADYAGAEHCTKDFWGNCEGNGRHHSRYRPCTKDYWGNCNDGRRRWRHYSGHRHVHQPNGESDRGVICQPRRRVVGEERSSKEKAQKAAEGSWMGAVRYDYGERYQDLNFAKDVRHNCDPSSVSRIVKTPFFRCVVEATPCRAPTGSTEERVERRYEVEGDD